MKTCEICDRPIKTGRKYCWEHRHTAQAEALRGDRVINEATEGYQKYHEKNYEYNKKKSFAIIITLIIAYSIIIFNIFGINSPISSILFIIGGMFIFLGLPPIINKYLGIKVKDRVQIEKEIENRDPKYVGWVKGWVKDEKEEREFKKSLLK